MRITPPASGHDRPEPHIRMKQQNDISTPGIPQH